MLLWYSLPYCIRESIMGGAATKQFNTERITAHEMTAIRQALSEMIDMGIRQRLLPKNVKWGIPYSFSEKDSFGDVDFLSTLSPETTDEWLNKMDELGLVRILGRVVNGTMRHYALSLPFSDKAFQMDTISVPFKRQFESHFYYYSYNILGNLIGKIAAYHNLYFGFNGLSKALYADKHGNLHEAQRMKSRQENPQSFSTKEVFPLKYKDGTFWDNLEFLGFDPMRYRKGFRTLEDIFQYVVESRYFCHETFLLENINSKDNARDRKSVNYQLFLDYIRTIPEKTAEPQLDLYGLYRHFPHLPQQVRHFAKKTKSAAYNKGKFNAHAVKLRLAQMGVVFDNIPEPYQSGKTLFVPNAYLSEVMKDVTESAKRRYGEKGMSQLSRKAVMAELSDTLHLHVKEWENQPELIQAIKSHLNFKP